MEVEPQNQEISPDMIAQAILAAEEAGNTGEADQLRSILSEKFPDWTPQLKQQQNYVYSEEQLLKNAENQELIAERENLQTIADSKHLGDFPIQAVLNSFTSGYMFIGEGMDEMVGAVHGEEAMEATRQLNEAFAEQYPKTNFALRMGGGVTSAIPMGSLAITQKMYKFIQGIPGIWRYIASFTTGAGIGATEGTITGAQIQGEGETGGYQNRIENAMDRGMSGFIWGGAGQTVATGITDVGSILWTKLKLGLKDESIPVIKELFGIGTKAAQVIKKTVNDATAPFSVLRDRLMRGGKDVTLADADQAMASILDVINVQGGASSNIIKDQVWGRAQTVAQGLDNALDRYIEKLPFRKDATKAEIKKGTAIKQDAHDIAEDAALGSAKARNKAYTKAYNTKIDYNSKEGKAILEILSRIDPSVRQAAMKTANKRLAWNKHDIGQQGFKLNPDKTLQWVENPNMLQLDYIKRALGELGYSIQSIQKGMNRFVDHPDAKLYREMYTALNKTLRDANPNYVTATKLGQDNITRRNALDVGSNLLDDALNVNALKRMMETAGEAELKMARYGLRGAIEDSLNNVKTSINSPDVDINQMYALLRNLSSKNSRNKITELLGKKNADKLFKVMDRADVALTLKAEIAKGSQTATRITGKQTLEEITDAGVLQNVAKGELPLASKELIQKISRSKIIFGKRKEIIMKDIANAMLESKGSIVRKQYKQLYDAVKRGEATEQQILEIAELIASRLTIAPINFSTQLMEDTDIEDRALLGISNALQGQGK